MKRFSLRNKKILVIGGAGFMGSNFIRHIIAHEPRTSIVNLDLLTYAGLRENLAGMPRGRHRLVRGSICDFEKVSRLMRDVHAVVNFAAETHVDRSIHESAAPFLETNVRGVHVLLEALRKAPHVDRLIHVSTDEVWGSLPLTSKKKFTEESLLKPSSPYAASKAAADLLIHAYTRTFNVPVIVSRSTNNFGPRQFPEKIIPFFILRALNHEPLPLYGDGKYVRDWLYVDDHSRALTVLFERGVTGEVYTVAREGPSFSNIAIAKSILDALGKPHSLITFVKDRPAHDRRYAASAQKLRGLGWKPRHAVPSALRETIAWYKSNTAWLKLAARRGGGLNVHIDI